MLKYFGFACASKSFPNGEVLFRSDYLSKRTLSKKVGLRPHNIDVEVLPNGELDIYDNRSGALAGILFPA